MRKIVIKDEVIYLTEKERRELLKRFDLGRVVKHKDEEVYRIPGSCYLCEKYRPSGEGGCDDCPLNTKVNTCGEFMMGIVGDDVAFAIEANNFVWWGFDDNRKARGHVRKIHKALLGMERVKERGG